MEKHAALQTKLLQLVVFVFAGVALTAVPEWQNNVLMNPETAGWTGYQGTLTLNAILLVFSYVIFSFLKKRFSTAKTLAVLFTFWGIAGLLIEWVFINHPPWSESIQYIMFVYWGAVFSVPSLLTIPEFKEQRHIISVFVASAAIMVLGSVFLLTIDPTKGFVLLFTILSWSFLYSYLVGFLLVASGHEPRRKWLLASATVVPVAEVALPFPADFAFFLLAAMLLYWKLPKKI